MVDGQRHRRHLIQHKQQASKYRLIRPGKAPPHLIRFMNASNTMAPDQLWFMLRQTFKSTRFRPIRFIDRLTARWWAGNKVGKAKTNIGMMEWAETENTRITASISMESIQQFTTASSNLAGRIPSGPSWLTVYRSHTEIARRMPPA